MLLTKSTGGEICCTTLCRTIVSATIKQLSGCLGVFVNGSYREERLCWKVTTNTKHNWCILIKMKHFSRPLFISSPCTLRSSGALYRGWALTGEERFQNNLHTLGFNPLHYRESRDWTSCAGWLIRSHLLCSWLYRCFGNLLYRRLYLSRIFSVLGWYSVLQAPPLVLYYSLKTW